MIVEHPIKMHRRYGTRTCMATGSRYNDTPCENPWIPMNDRTAIQKGGKKIISFSCQRQPAMRRR
jgi:hypothetical protein